MKTFEYKVIEILQEDMETECNTLGNDGWEVVKIDGFTKSTRDKNNPMFIVNTGDYYKIILKKENETRKNT